MKTPRELLFERHRHAQPKLDALRRETLAATTKPVQPAMSLRDMLRSLRWHLAGMSALWALVLFLHLGTGSETSMIASIPPAKIPPPQVVMAALRENRRQLFEMIDARPPENEHRELILPKPRSEWHGETLTA
jgi:hypothetical protein